MKSTKIVQVDAFTNRPFAGNPAAVCILNAPASDSWMQRVANEMNLSETAFLHLIDGGPQYRLRWFTPEVEVDLCGHATLASAHVLFQEGLVAPDATAEFMTRSGLLKAVLHDGGWIELDFPAKPADKAVHDSGELDRIASALRSPVVSAARNGYDLLVELADEAAVRAVAPDFGRVEAIADRGVIVTSRSTDPAYDFVSRFFAPKVGIDEDPVCGSAHCCSGPYWAERLGRNELNARQVSAREGILRLRMDQSRVCLMGQAVTVLRSEFIGAASDLS